MTPLDRINPPVFTEIDNIPLPEPTTHRLSNQVPVYIFRTSEVPLVKVEFIFQNHWSASNPLLSSASVKLASEGTHQRTSAEIADAIDQFGSFYQTAYHPDHATVSVYSLQKFLKPTLDVVAEILSDAEYPINEIETFVTNHLQRLQVDRQKNRYLAGRSFFTALFGKDHPYGHAEQEIDYTQLHQQDLRGYYKAFIKPASNAIFASGPLKQADIDVIDALFGKRPVENRIDANREAKATHSEAYYQFDAKKDSLQSAIYMGMPIFTKNHPDYPAMQVVSTLLGGYFGSRLMANLREDKGYTYGVQSALVSYVHEGLFYIFTEVGAEVTRQAHDEIRFEINKLRNEEVGPEELELVRNYMLGSLVNSLENAFSYADKFKAVMFYGLDLSYYERFFNVIKNINTATILELAKTYLDPDKMYTRIVGLGG